MRFAPADLRKLIQETLQPMTLWTPDVEELLMATCAQESLLGTYRTQGGGGPARGIFQMEKEDHDDIWENYLKYHEGLANKVKQLSATCTVDDLVNNDKYAVAMARIHYLRKPGKVPNRFELEDIWDYYKRWYNTEGGAATQEEFYDHYHTYVTDGVAQ